MTRVAVLCGGRSYERAVSLRSGARVEQALLGVAGWEPVRIDLDGNVDAVQRLRSGGFDVAFIALHGKGGEDGTAQQLCEQAGVPYTGSRALPSRAAFDKATAKRLLLAAGVPTPGFITSSTRAIEDVGVADIRSEAAALGLPLVVKPARGGSSLGTRFVDEIEELSPALMGAFSYDDEVLLEQHVAGRELSITVLEQTDGLRALPAVEIVPRHADWFDYESRYGHGETEFTCPPEGIDGSVLEHVAGVAEQACDALDIAGFGRVDVLLDGQGQPWVLEVAPVPGLTETSLVPIACEAAGITFEQLVLHLLQLATSAD